MTVSDLNFLIYVRDVIINAFRVSMIVHVLIQARINSISIDYYARFFKTNIKLSFYHLLHFQGDKVSIASPYT